MVALDENEKRHATKTQTTIGTGNKMHSCQIVQLHFSKIDLKSKLFSRKYLHQKHFVLLMYKTATELEPTTA